MVAAANLVEVAALVGDTARATMLNALMGGQSLTATELAYCAVVSRIIDRLGHPLIDLDLEDLGQSRPSRCTLQMSAIEGKADMTFCTANVCL